MSIKSRGTRDFLAETDKHVLLWNDIDLVICYKQGEYGSNP